MPCDNSKSKKLKLYWQTPGSLPHRQKISQQMIGFWKKVKEKTG